MYYLSEDVRTTVYQGKVYHPSSIMSLLKCWTPPVILSYIPTIGYYVATGLTK